MNIIFVVETTRISSHIIYYNPNKQDFENYFKTNDDQIEDIQVFVKEKITDFLERQTAYFGIVNQRNIFNFAASVLGDLLAPSKLPFSQELHIDDLVLITNSINLKIKDSAAHAIRGYTLALQLESQEIPNINYYKDALNFLSKSLLQDEQTRNYITLNVMKIFNLYGEYEKRLNQIHLDTEIQKCSKSEISQILSSRIKEESDKQINQIEIYQLLQNFIKSIEKFTQINVNNFVLNLPNPNISLNSIPKVVKSCQTLLPNKKEIEKVAIISQRFQKFMQCVNPRNNMIKIILLELSFDEISQKYNFTMNEINVFVTHLLIHQKATIMNKLQVDSYFTTNPTFNYIKSLDSLNSKIFKSYDLELLKIIAAFNNPSTIQQIAQQYPGLNLKCILELLSYKIIKEVEVYIYLKNPFITVEEMKSIIQKCCENTPLNENISRKASIKIEEDVRKIERTDLFIFQNLLHYFGKKIGLHEISKELYKDLQSLWKFIHKYEQEIGYYFSS